MNTNVATSRTKVWRLIAISTLALTIAAGCASNPGDSRAKQGAKSGAALGAGIGLLLGVLSGDSKVAAAAVAVGAASGAVSGGYEGWRQDQDDERTRQITDAIKQSNSSEQQASMNEDARKREELTRFLGVWQMKGWVQEEGEGRVNVSSQVNANIVMQYFVELAWVDLKADGFDQQIWGTSTLGFDQDSGYELTTRFNTVPDALEVSGGSFSQSNRTFTFADSAGTTTIRFQTPDHFYVETRVGNQTVESYEFTRS